MFTPRAFAATDLQWLDRLLARDAFVTLLTTGADGLPHLTRLPVLYRRDGDQVLLEGHWARANPQARMPARAEARTGADADPGAGGDADARARVLVDGPHGYISASWYPDKVQAARVPTWNYATAELTGTLQRFDDPAALADLVARLAAHFEDDVGQAWRFDRDNPREAAQLRGIVGFRFVATDLQITLKLSQNHPEANQLAAIAELEQLGRPSSIELAQWMRLLRETTATGG